MLPFDAGLAARSLTIGGSMSTPIRGVLFDYGLVLSGPPDPAAWEHMKALLHAEEEPFAKAYWRPRHAYDRGDLNANAYWDEVAGELQQRLDDAGRSALKAADVALWTQRNEPMIAWAATLQTAGVPTGILSNIGDAMEAGVRTTCAWLGGFAHHTFSHSLGIAKPELAIYRHAAEGLGLAPAEILFVDDREDNIAAARAAGMRAIRYTDHEAFVKALRAADLERLLAPASRSQIEPSKVRP